MQLSQQQCYALIDRVVHEGEPELLLAPMASPPADIPAAWGKLLTAHDWQPALADLWRPMADRLPRVYRALRERLKGIALVQTEEVPSSLIYFFSQGDYLFKYRGGPPVEETRLVESRLPQEFTDFYRIHDGWVLFHSEDMGPAPRSEWRALPSLWPDVSWNVPPGEVSPDHSTVIYRDSNQLALAFDTSVSPAPALLCRGDGSVELLLDTWATIDRYIGEFLEQLDPARASLETGAPDSPRYDKLLTRLAEIRGVTSALGTASVHEQACDLYLTRALTERRSRGNSERLREYHRQALDEWCASIEASGRTSPREVLSLFGLAHIVGDRVTGHFIASLPLSTWLDDSLESIQLLLLFNLFRGEWAYADQNFEKLAGLTLDGEEAPPHHAELVFRLLESLFRKDWNAFAEWRRKAERFSTSPSELHARLPRDTRLAAFDAVAVRLGLAEPRKS
jgi:hypothetical protein